LLRSAAETLLLRLQTRRERIPHHRPCSQQTRSYSSYRDVQDPCSFRHTEILDVLQEEHFAICCGKSLHRTTQRVAQFVPMKCFPSYLVPRSGIPRAGRRFATETSPACNRREDFFKAGSCNCFCAHTALDKDGWQKLQTKIDLTDSFLLFSTHLMRFSDCALSSIFVARMKSLSVRPLILCVQVVISTFPQARKMSGW